MAKQTDMYDPTLKDQSEYDHKEIYIISNTHWDREWVYPSAETRLLMLEFMDNMLDLLDKQPDYHSFTMDSQTLCIQDYLDFRPERREQIERHVKSGRLIIGPWCSLPEEYIVNGESLVRNLVIGHKVANSLGKVSKVGYTPFSYGQTSQMPQIYRGFDIDTIIFYRGIKTEKSEFIMRGPDGSELLGMRFGALSRFSYFFYLFRMVAYNMSRDEAKYDWFRGSLPFKLAGDHHVNAHYYICDPDATGWHTEHIDTGARKLLRDESQHFSTRYIASMQGFDSSEPDPRELDLIKETQKHLPNHVIKQSDLAEFMDRLKEEVAAGRLKPEVIEGESRNPNSVGKWTHLFGDVISSRVRIKLMNNANEQNVQRKAEPFCALAMTLGAKYPTTVLDECWDNIMKNHPHDTICGAGVDQMEKDMIARGEQVNIFSEGLYRRALQKIQTRIDNSDVAANEIALTVFNPSPFPRSEVVSVLLDLPDVCKYEDFTIRDEKGNKVEAQYAEFYPWGTLVRNLRDVSLQLHAERVRVHFEALDVPPFGYRTYTVKHEEDVVPKPMKTLVTAVNTMENEHLKVKINANGTLQITNKETGDVFDNMHYLEDGGENGHSWTTIPPDHDEIITSHGANVYIAQMESGPALARFRVEYHMMIPEALDFETMEAYTGQTPRAQIRHPRISKRSERRKEMVIRSEFTLRKGSKVLEVYTKVNNECENHRLRVCFPTGIQAATSDSEASFDVIQRQVIRTPDNWYWGRPNPVLPMHRFVSFSNGKSGITFLNNGIREYEAMEDADRTVALTLFRAFTFRNPPILDTYDVYPEMKLSQCPGEMEFRYNIYPHKGDWAAAEVYKEADHINLPLEVAEVGPHKGDLPKSMSFLSISPANLVLSAFKKAEERDTFILRVFNPTGDAMNGTITFYRPIKKAWLCNMNEERRQDLEPKGNVLTLDVPKKKIMTIEFEV
ncbi:MAG TPA: glycoside hydrolase family 38 C-terminal domain-containing protein [Candidatus Latescibacteria bacterium]|nr:glycoside hydrolase family 38 C-terminal domain-containing protein [Candidatus Latescibacterota bacterium]